MSGSKDMSTTKQTVFETVVRVLKKCENETQIEFVYNKFLSVFEHMSCLTKHFSLRFLSFSK